jgi:hypothetical protein
MTKVELIAILANYADDQLVLVESAQGFEEPNVYVAAIRSRRADEFDDALAGDYVAPGLGQAAQGAVVIGTVAGFLRSF